MLNELYSLSTTLKNKGISTKEWHREYKLLPKVTAKAPCIRIWLANDGSIRGLESISAELAQLLRKYGNNQGTFPAFNIAPLYRITDKEQLFELERIEKGTIPTDFDKIKSWCVNDNWKERIVKKIDRCLHNIPQTLSDLIGNQEQPERTLISQLIRLASGFTNEPDKSFKSALEKRVFAKLQKQEDIGILLAMLFHKGNPQKNHNDDTGVSISVVLDLFDWQKYGYPVASKHTTEWINEMLLKSSLPSTSTQSEGDGSDAFGMPFVNPDEPMSSVKLSGFEVTLRSMFNGQPCQYRYERIDDGSYPIAEENRSLVKQSLEWVASLDREGVTWRKIDKNEIVFVYPSKLPEVPPKFASIFGSSQAENSVQTEARFESIAKSISPINVVRHTNTKKAAVQEGKDSGMAPLAFRIVEHGVYCMPFFVNPNFAAKTGCTEEDIDLLKLLIPKAYDLNRSAIRTDVRIRHAWYVEHLNALGSCPDYLLLEALTPKRIGDTTIASSNWADYEDKTVLPKELEDKVRPLTDLML